MKIRFEWKSRSGVRRSSFVEAAVAFAVILLAGPAAILAEEVWIGTNSGNWSVSSAWSDGTPPPTGGDPELDLRFAVSGATAITATNDLGAPFVFNKLVLDSSSIAMLTLASTAGNSLEIAGANPAIELRGTGDTTISSALALNPESGNVIIAGPGSGNLTISGAIGQAGGVRSLLINGTPLSANTQMIALSGANTFAGGVTLNSGNLSLNSSAALGSGALTVNGGTLRFGGSFSLGNAITLQSDLVVTSAGQIAGAITSATPGTGLTLRSESAILNLTAASTYTGPTTIDFALNPSQATGAGTLRLSANAALPNTSAIYIRAGGTLQIDGVNGPGDRLPDTATVELRSGRLLFNGVFGTNAQTETIGAVSGAGFSRLAFAPNGGTGNTRLTAASLARVERGTFLFSGLNLGGAFANGTANLLFATAPVGLVGGGGAGADTSILPYAIGETSFVTYAAGTGIRPLNTATEYVSSLTSATQTSNVRLTSNAANSGVKAINALLIGTGGGVSGSGTLAIGSGAVLSTANSVISGPAIDFGAVEANIFAVSPLTILSPISGSNGLTKSGDAELKLSGSNTFNGPLTINAGWIGFSSLENLGASTSPIVLGGTGAGLDYAGSSSLALARDIQLTAGIGGLNVSGSSGNLVVNGVISGPGGLRLSAGSNLSAPTVTLNGANSYTGPTLVTGTVNLAINSDTALGQGGALDLATTGRLTLAGPWLASRPISFSLASQLDTAGFSATLDGVLTGSAALTKLGAGALRLSADSPYSGDVSISAGAFELRGAGAVRSTSWSLSAGTSLTLDSATTASSRRLNDAARVTLDRAALSVLGNSATPVVERFATLVARGPSTLTLTAPGSAGTILGVDMIDVAESGAGTPSVPGSALLIRGDNLGGGPAGPFTRVTANTFRTPAGSVSVSGLVPGVFIADATGLAESFGIDDTTIDAAGKIGLRAIRAAEYATGAIQNPQHGGATTETAHFLAANGATAVGTSNTVATLTMEPGIALTLGNDQTLVLSTGSILARSGGTSAAIMGGTLDIGQGRGAIYTAGDLTVSSTIAGSGSLVKIGPGTLGIGGAMMQQNGLEISAGMVRLDSGASVGGLVTVNPNTTLAVSNNAASVGGLTGTGAIMLNAGTLAFGALDTDLTFAGAIGGTGSLVIDGGATGTRLRTLSGANTFSGGTRLRSGRLTFSGATPLGTGPLTVENGALFSGLVSSGPALTLSQAVVINGTLRIEGAAPTTFAPGAILSGGGTIEVRGSGGLSIQTASTHTGETRSVFGFAEAAFQAPGNIDLSGATGSIAASSAVQVAPGSSLTINDATAFTGPAAGRLGDATSLFLRDAKLNLLGNSSAATTEKFGSLNGSGYSTVTISPGASAGAQLTASALNRVDRGTFFFRAPGLGNAPGAGVGSMIFQQSPPGLIGGGGAGPNVSILPYAVGASSTTGTPLGLVTYDPIRGIRLLNDATEYTASLTAAAPTHNVRLLGAVTNSSDVTVNALVLAGTTTINGAGTIHITSGALLKAPAISTTGTIANSLDFGTAEANVFVGDPGDNLLLDGVIMGSGGLTKSGDGTLRLSGANSFTGPLTINSGNLQFGSLASLGLDTQPIAIGGNLATTTLAFIGTKPVTLARDLHLNGGLANLQPGAGLTIGGTISGDGGLRVSRISSGDGYVVLPNANSYAGPTVIDSPLAIASDASLGHGSSVTLRDTLRLDGPWTSVRTFEIGGFRSTIDTNGFDAKLDAPIIDGVMAGTNTRGFAKSGAGTLTLTKNSPFSGRLFVDGGTLLLTDAARLAATEISVGGTGELRLDNSTVVSADRISDGAMIALSGKGLTLIGNANVPVTEKLGYMANFFGADLLVNPGNTATALSLNMGSAGQHLLFRGDALGAGPGGAFTRVRLAAGTALTNGLLPNALADASAFGSGNSFATYDTTVDAAGVIGVRPLRASEYVTGSLIQNPTNGGITPVTANYLIDGSTSAVGASNTINSLTFAGLSRLTLGAGQQFDMTNSPGILAQLGAMATIDGGNIITSNAFTGTLVSFHLQGDGDLTLHNTKIAPLPAANSLEVVKLGAGVLTLDGAQITAPIRVENGTLRLSPGDGVSGTQFTLDVGTTLALTGASARIGWLDGAGSVLLGAGELTLGRGTFDGSISGSGGLRVIGQGFMLRSPASYSGPTRVDGSGGSAFTLTGSGSALMSSKFVISGGTLILDRLGSVPSRIGVVPIELNGGAVTFNGDSVATKQSAGLLTSSGLSKVSVQPFGSTGPLAHLEFGGIERVDRGAFSFILGSGSDANARLTFGSEAMAALVGAGTSLANQPILPFAISGNSLITYNPVTGVRVVDMFAELSDTLVAGNNVRLNGTTTVASDIAVNSLFCSYGTVNGPGTLTVNSGVILGAGLISAPVSFGNAEAQLYGPNFPNVLSLAGPISGSNGVTISAAYPSATIELGGQNTFTGPLTINAGILRFSSAANLGADTSAIVINDARLQYAGGSAFVLTRPLRLNGYSATLAGDGAGPLTIAQPITGTGGLLIQGDVVLTATNTYTGTTNVEGKLTISSDAALGSGPLRLASVPETLGLLTLAGPWTTSRTVEVGVTSSPTRPDTIDTAGFDAALNGPLISGVGATPSLIKIGAGNLSIANAATYMGDLVVNGGTVSINSAMPAGGVLTVGIDGTLAGTGTIQRMATINGTLAPGNGGPGTLSVAGVSFANGSTFAIDIASASAFDQLNCSGTVSLSGTINLALALGFDPSDGLDSFVVLANDAADAIIGTGRLAIDGNPLDEGEMFSVGSQEFRISYTGGTGNDVVLDAVPEPTTCILLIAGSLLLGGRRFRKSNARPHECGRRG